MSDDLVEAVNFTWRQVRKIVVLIVGSVVILVGVVMLITPGPAFVVIPAGIAILSIEFPWAKRLFVKIQVFFYMAIDYIQRHWRQICVQYPGVEKLFHRICGFFIKTRELLRRCWKWIRRS